MEEIDMQLDTNTCCPTSKYVSGHRFTLKVDFFPSLISGFTPHLLCKWRISQRKVLSQWDG